MTQPPPRKPRFLSSVPAQPVEAARFGAKPASAPAQLRQLPDAQKQEAPKILPAHAVAADKNVARAPAFFGTPAAPANNPAPAPHPAGAAPVPAAAPAPGAANTPGAVQPKTVEVGAPVVPVEMIRERLAAAIDSLRMQSEKLAEQARADTLEMAFQIARRIVEVEVRQSPEPLFALVRSSIMQLAAARRITLRVCPGDLESLRSPRGQEATAGLSLAQIELSADASLEPGECLVESDLGQIDGRLANRFAELRRQVSESSESVA